MSVWRLMDWFTNWWRMLTAKKLHSILHYVRLHIAWVAGQVVSGWTLHCLGNEVMPVILLQKWHLLIWKYGPIFSSSNAWFYLIMFMKYADGCLEWVTVKRVLQFKQNTSQYIYWELSSKCKARSAGTAGAVSASRTKLGQTAGFGIEMGSECESVFQAKIQQVYDAEKPATLAAWQEG